MPTWPIKKLWRLAQFLRGSGLSKKDLAHAGIHKCILYGQLYTTYGPVIDEVVSKTNKSGNMLSVAGDVLVPGTTTADEIGIAVASALNESGVILGGDINIIRTENKLLDSKFLAYLLSGPLKMRMVKYARGTNIIHLAGRDIAKIEVPIPPKDIQKQIVDRLDKIAEAQKLNDELIKKIDELFQSLLHKELNPEGKNWEDKKLGNILCPQYGYTTAAQDSGKYRFIRITDINENGELSVHDKKYVTINSDKAKSYKLNYGDLLLARTGATFGKILYFKDNEPSIFASFLIRLNPKTSVIDPFYIWLFSRSHSYWQQAKSLVTGSGQPQFNANKLKQIRIPLPPHKIQKQIVEKLMAVQEYKKQLLEQKTKLKELFNSVLHKSMNEN